MSLIEKTAIANCFSIKRNMIFFNFVLALLALEATSFELNGKNVKLGIQRDLYSSTKENITSIAFTAFLNYPRISTISIVHSPLTSLDLSVFQTLSRLISLKLHSNRIERILPRNDTSSLRALSYLDLSNNNLKFIDPRIFDKLYGLTSLHLESNKIHYLPDGVFKDLTVLGELFLSQNFIFYVHERAFTNLTSLLVLEMFNNTLVYAQPEVFLCLEKLIYLDLCGNKLRWVSRSNCDRLEMLRLVETRLNCSQPPESLTAENYTSWFVYNYKGN